MIGRGIDARAWPQPGAYYHTSNGRAYGPSLPGETLADYRERVRRAYGTLRGITFERSNRQ